MSSISRGHAKSLYPLSPNVWLLLSITIDDNIPSKVAFVIKMKQKKKSCSPLSDHMVC